MFRIRFHGRGGQGTKTASRILGSAFFLAGYEVQDAPLYGAERRGAPIFAYVRAAKEPINERGIIGNPDLVVVADDTLFAIPAAGVLHGIQDTTVFLIHSSDSEEQWQSRLNLRNNMINLPYTEQREDRANLPYIGAICAGAAACLLRVITREILSRAIEQELEHLGDDILATNLNNATAAYDYIDTQTTIRVSEGGITTAQDFRAPEWIELPFENAQISAPAIHTGLTSVQVKTGLWRTMRPIIDYELCNNCWWICSTLCPDAAIAVNDNRPEIDYDHCKGCLVCLAQCPPHAIRSVPESQALVDEKQAQQNEHSPPGGGQ